MKPNRIKALSTVPLIAGVMFLLRSVSGFFSFFNRFTEEDLEIKSEVEITTHDQLGSVVDKRRETRYGTGLPGFLALAFIVFSFFFGGKVIDISQFIIFETPYLMLSPIFIAGFIASLYKKDLQSADTGLSFGVKGYSWHYVVGFILSFPLTYCLWVLDAFEIDPINAFTIGILALPLTFFVFVSFVAPLSLCITAIFTHLRIKKLRALYSPVLPVFILSAYILHTGHTSKLNELGVGNLIEQVRLFDYRNSRPSSIPLWSEEYNSYYAERALFDGTGNNYSKALKNVYVDIKNKFIKKQEYFEVLNVYSGYLSYEMFKEFQSTNEYKVFKNQTALPENRGSLFLDITPYTNYYSSRRVKLYFGKDGKRHSISYKPGMLLPSGYYKIVATQNGYRDTREQVYVKNQETIIQSIHLSESRR
ncbi:hypothetical protein [Vibrio sp. LaRot3]|uniref:hypothetical protein n=1 Tax=Vibrio sp. LaRot3 TaxID=2998829 RepID=UPI0022CDDA81|nr:hypothetical protein [Vibrio sp. LaRot3]MDA0149365.1 hypothetical protein [Vibrio sp. LaRot3]